MRRRALSLLEVVVTASVLAIVFMLLMNMFPTALFGIRQSEHRLFAAGLAQGVLDECMAAPYSNIRHNGNYTPDTPGPLGEILRRQYDLTDDGTRYLAELYISDPNGTVPRSRLARVRIRVSWRERGHWKSLERQQQIANLQR